MELEIIDYPKDDCLKIVRLVCVDVFQNKTMKFLLLISLNVCLLITLAQTYNFVKIFDGYYFIQYAPMFFALQSATVTISGQLLLSDATSTTLSKLTLWKFKDKNNKISENINNHSQIITAFVVVNTIMALLGGFNCMISGQDDDEDIFFIYVLIKDFILPSWKYKISVLFGICCAFLCYVGVTNLFQFLYSAFHVKFQIDIMLHHVESINDLGQNRDDTYLLNCEDYQNKIKNNLKTIIDRHNQFQDLAASFMKKFRLVILLYTITGGLFIISLMFFLFTGGFVTTYLRIILMGVTSFSTAASVVFAGQQIQDGSSRSFDTYCRLKWYNWNKENKKLYLMMLANSLVPVKIKFSENIAVNYQLGLSIARTVYSVVSVLTRIKTLKF